MKKIAQRPLKFRVWDIKNKTWLVLYNYKTDIVLNQDGYLSGLYEFETKKYIIQQFTGLTDKNGKKIFEGDIVKCSYRTEEVFEITFGNGGFRLNGVTHIGVLNKTEITVIGNIFETPELLK
jgi:uncharacterized phage protein (TIGR01671 family)